MNPSVTTSIDNNNHSESVINNRLKNIKRNPNTNKSKNVKSIANDDSKLLYNRYITQNINSSLPLRTLSYAYKFPNLTPYSSIQRMIGSYNSPTDMTISTKSTSSNSNSYNIIEKEMRYIDNVIRKTNLNPLKYWSKT